MMSQSSDLIPNGATVDLSADEFGNPRVKDLEIDPPIEWNNKTYEVLHLEEPTAIAVQRSEEQLAGGVNLFTLRKAQIVLVSLCSDTPRAVIEKLRISQLVEASDFLLSFRTGGRQIGEI